MLLVGAAKLLTVQRTMGEAGVCRDCGARVLWVGTQNGRTMALDYEPERRFVLDAVTMVAKQRNTYVCHFETCKKRG